MWSCFTLIHRCMSHHSSYFHKWAQFLTTLHWPDTCDCDHRLWYCSLGHRCRWQLSPEEFQKKIQPLHCADLPKDHSQQSLPENGGQWIIYQFFYHSRMNNQWWTNLPEKMQALMLYKVTHARYKFQPMPAVLGDQEIGTAMYLGSLMQAYYHTSWDRETLCPIKTFWHMMHVCILSIKFYMMLNCLDTINESLSLPSTRAKLNMSSAITLSYYSNSS